MSLQVASPFQQFFDRDGSPLDNGFVYVGTANLNPETNPVAVYFDDARTIPAAQPLRTSNGYIVRNGSPARVYMTGENFSLTVRDKNGALVFTVPDAKSPRDRVSVRDFGAVCDGVTNDTLAIQAAINYVHAAGGGTVWVDGSSYVGNTSETDDYLTGDMITTQNVSGRACLVMRSGVVLQIAAGGGIRTDDPTLTLIILLDMTAGGGVIGDRGSYAKLTTGWTSSGAGHGLLEAISVASNKSGPMVYDALEIYNVGSYGIGKQHGFSDKSRCTNLYIHDTGADGIDNKARGLVGDGQPQAFFNNILIERHGQRTGITGSAGIDMRGGVVVGNIVVRDFAKTGADNVGLRFSSSVISLTNDEYRPPSNFSNASTITIDGGDPSIPTTGLVLLSSRATNVSNISVRNCQVAYSTGTASSGVGDTASGASINNFDAEGCWVAGVDVNSVGTTLIGGDVRGARDEFSEDRENLAIGQTVVVLPRPHRESDMAVYKNGSGVPLVLTTDYTVTASGGIVTAITLVTPIVASDTLAVVTPCLTGYDIGQSDCELIGCKTFDTTTPILETVVPLISGGNISRIREFTPVLADASTGGNVATLGYASGQYVVDGELVHVWITVTGIDTTGMTGSADLRIRDLPYPSNPVAGTARLLGAVRTRNVAFSGSLCADFVEGANTYLNIFDSQSGGGGARITVADLTSGSADIALQLTYPRRL